MRWQDAWEAAGNSKASKEELEVGKMKDDIEMNPTILCLEMFEEWFPQDAGKIKGNKNSIGPTKRMISTYCRKLYDHPYLEDKVAKILYCQEAEELAKWYHTPGLLHEKVVHII